MRLTSQLLLLLITIIRVPTSTQQFTGSPTDVVAGGGFSCSDREEGFYADVGAGCRGYYRCVGLGRVFRFECADGTLFNQKLLVCDHPHHVDCSQAERYFGKSVQRTAAGLSAPPQTVQVRALNRVDLRGSASRRPNGVRVGRNRLNSEQKDTLISSRRPPAFTTVSQGPSTTSTSLISNVAQSTFKPPKLVTAPARSAQHQFSASRIIRPPVQAFLRATSSPSKQLLTTGSFQFPPASSSSQISTIAAQTSRIPSERKDISGVTADRTSTPLRLFHSRIEQSSLRATSNPLPTAFAFTQVISDRTSKQPPPPSATTSVPPLTSLINERNRQLIGVTSNQGGVFFSPQVWLGDWKKQQRRRKARDRQRAAAARRETRKRRPNSFAQRRLEHNNSAATALHRGRISGNSDIRRIRPRSACTPCLRTLLVSWEQCTPCVRPL